MKLSILRDPFKDADPASIGLGSVELDNAWFDETAALRRRPGLYPWYGAGEPFSVDALYWWEKAGGLVAVWGGKLRFFSALDASPVDGGDSGGSNLLGPGAISIADGGKWLLATAGGKMTLWDGGSGTAQFLPYLPNASHVGWLNGKFVANDLDLGGVRFTEYFGTESTEPPVWADDYFTAEGNPDPIRALAVHQGELVLIGSKTTEFWYDAGDSPVPFARSQGAYLETGISVPGTLVDDKIALYWLNDRWEVVRMAGRQIQVLSGALEKFLREQPGIGRARMFKIDHWLVLTIPDFETYACNLKTGGWSRWTWMDPNTLVEGEWIGRCGVSIPDWQVHLLGTKYDTVIAAFHEDYNLDLESLISVRLVSGRIDAGVVGRKFSRKLTARVLRGV